MTMNDINNYSISRTIEELKTKFESKVLPTYELPMLSPQLYRLQTLKTSKVKQLASMYSSRIAQISKSPYSDDEEHSSSSNDLPPDDEVETMSYLTQRFPTPTTPVPSPKSKSKVYASMYNPRFSQISRPDDSNFVNDLPPHDADKRMFYLSKPFSTPKTPIPSPSSKSKTYNQRIFRNTITYSDDEENSDIMNDLPPYDELDTVSCLPKTPISSPRSKSKTNISASNSRISQLTRCYSDGEENSKFANDLPSYHEPETMYYSSKETLASKTPMSNPRNKTNANGKLYGSRISQFTGCYSDNEENSNFVNAVPPCDDELETMVSLVKSLSIPKTPMSSPRSKSKFNVSEYSPRISQISRRRYSDAELDNGFYLSTPWESSQTRMSSHSSKSNAYASTYNPRMETSKTPMPSPSKKSNEKTPQKTQYFVSEENFAKLRVKQKAELYTQFINEMSKNKTNFLKDAERMETNVNGEEQRSEVIHEKQKSVKNLLNELEAKCKLSRQTIPSRRNLARRNIKGSTKSKEVGEKFKKKSSLISTVAFKLEPSSSTKFKKEGQRRLFSCQKPHHESAFKTRSLIQPYHKRRNDQLRSCLPGDAYAPPKKIKRARSERLLPKICFNNSQVKSLFFKWLSEKNLKDQEKIAQATAEKKAREKILEDAITKLNNFHFEDRESHTTETAATGENLTKKAASSMAGNKTCSIAFGKLLEGKGSESARSSLSKIASNAQAEEADHFEKYAEVAKPFKFSRRKKLRRTVTWKNYMPFPKPQPINSTDSDNDYKNKMFLPQSENNHIKNDAAHKWSNASNTQDLDATLKPQQGNSCYSLTASSPTPYHPQPGTSNFSPLSADNSSYRKRLNSKSAPLDILSGAVRKKPNIDSFIDQGFETGSNDTDSSARAAKLYSLQVQTGNNFFPLSPDSETAKTENENPFHSSTPIKRDFQPPVNFHNNSSIHQQHASPITLPMKGGRRKSTYDPESRTSSLSMHVIREGQPLEQPETTSPLKMNNSEQMLYANAATPAMSTQFSALDPNKTSQFWIKSGDFSISHEICYTDDQRLRLLYDIFSQTSCDTKELNFGIDKLKFSMQHVCEPENVSKRFIANENYSHYWFSTGDLAIPFIGKFLSADKIKRLFEFIKRSAEENDILRFGVDAVEFSNVSQLWNQSPNFSLDSSYSMLVGLQSGNSNGLEGRSKFSWPNLKHRIVSDLDKTDNGGQGFEENNNYRQSRSPFNFNNLDLASLSTEEFSLPRNSEAMMNGGRQSFSMKFENESLDNMFDEQQTAALHTSSTFPDQQDRFSVLQEKLSKYNISNGCNDTEYSNTLKGIITEISRKGLENGFKDCTIQQLENYVLILSRCASIHLHNRKNHMQKVLHSLQHESAVAY